MLSLIWKIQITQKFFCLWSLRVLTLHVYCLINRTTYTLFKNSKNLVVSLEIDITKSVLFSSVDGLDTKCYLVETHVSVAQW